ncbi:PAS domain S-box protein [Chloroflexales bacterium ZM16-3]|nr:PAS domain S-box protein [Chloroflexales bacterium ZM16-3]
MTSAFRITFIIGSVIWLLGEVYLLTNVDLPEGLLIGAALGLGGLLIGAAASQLLRKIPSQPGDGLGPSVPNPTLNMRALFDESPSALVLFRVHDGMILDVNTMAAQHYGQTRDELRGRNIIDLDLPPTIRDYDTPMGNPTRQQVRRAGGELRNIEVTVKPIPWVGPSLRYAIIQDVTPDAKRASHLAAMVAAAMDGIIQINSNQQITLVNTAAEELFGYPAVQLIGQPLEMLIPESSRSRHNIHIREFIQSGITARRHKNPPILTARRSDGATIPVEISLTTTHTDHQQITTAIVRDASDRLQHEREQQVLVEFTSALRSTTNSVDLATTLTDQISTRLLVPHLVLLLCDEQSGGVQIVCARGAWAKLGDQADQAAALELCLSHSDPSDDTAPAILNTKDVMITSIVLSVHQQHIGVLWVGRGEAFSPSDRRLLTSLAEVGASALRRAQWSERLEQANIALREAYDATIAGWARALDLRDRETEDHSRRVAELTVALARQIGVPAPEIEHLRRGALLHDIGKMGVPDAILNKTGPLTDEERAVIQRHPTDAYHILAPIAYLSPALDIPLAHHERWDGSGYPAGLRGEDIPFAARIFAVVDVWDALTNDRPYREAWDTERALGYLQEHAGKLFDPQVVHAFTTLVGKG